ncbi:MAG: sigma-54 dependent transcriptional regulator [Gammaproteobacteria bacterium]|nr:sigma-54 dependent transcriptional regulator [Gammaproteobacteria bacterium]
MNGRILVVEDDSGLLELLREELEEDGHEVTTASTLAEAREALDRRTMDLVITDLRLPDGRGDALLGEGERGNGEEEGELRSVAPSILVITAFGSVRDAVAALKAGADDFLTKPLDLEHLRLTARRLLEMRRVRGELARFRRMVRDDGFHGMVGHSEPMRRLIDQIRVIAQADRPVLIVGESGTGKEQVARALHAESPRAGGPFVAVNCAGVPAELLESEFFGHVRGAFTGAARDHDGLFRQADGGTLLLDEIGEMPMALQAKLLRVLEEQTIRRVGGSEEEAVDVRVLAATNRDIDQHLAEGHLREDLYFRLEAFTLELPALRDRGEDLELLAGHFLTEFSRRHGRSISGFSAAALAAIERHSFPGNVRELRNVVERAVLFCSGELVQPGDLPRRLLDAEEVADGDPAPDPFADQPSIELLQQRYASWLLERVGGNKKKAAEILGVTRGTLYRWLEAAAGDAD